MNPAPLGEYGANALFIMDKKGLRVSIGGSRNSLFLECRSPKGEG